MGAPSGGWQELKEHGSHGDAPRAFLMTAQQPARLAVSIGRSRARVASRADRLLGEVLRLALHDQARTVDELLATLELDVSPQAHSKVD
jgi:hypothetical protein